MNITCIICSDVFLPHSEVYTTQCGHLFHYHCLIQWIERSKTCPQCRARATEKTIYRIFFTLANSDHIADDVVTLQNKLDNLQFQMSLKEKDLKILQEKYSKSKKQTIGLRAEVAEIENKIRLNDSVVHALKDQIAYFKKKSKERDRLAQELQQTKNHLKDIQMVNIAVTGTREEVNNILKNESNIESLVILSATLKKALMDAENKKHNAEHKLKQLQNEVSKYRRDISCLETSNNELRKELQSSKQSWEQEKEHLTKIVKKFNKNGAEEKTPIIKRILAESPIPLTLNYSDDNNEIINLDGTSSPSMEKKVVNILESDSPYLPVKSNGVSLFRNFKHSSFLRKAMESGKAPNTDELVYDGLGGHSKKEVFPIPKVSALGIKRYKTTSQLNVSSAKHRKLNPASYSIK